MAFKIMVVSCMSLPSTGHQHNNKTAQPKADNYPTFRFSLFSCCFVAWKRGLPQTFACCGLSYSILFNLLCVWILCVAWFVRQAFLLHFHLLEHWGGAGGGGTTVYAGPSNKTAPLLFFVTASLYNVADYLALIFQSLSLGVVWTSTLAHWRSQWTTQDTLVSVSFTVGLLKMLLLVSPLNWSISYRFYVPYLSDWCHKATAFLLFLWVFSSSFFLLFI